MTSREMIDELMVFLQSLKDVLEIKNPDEYNNMFPDEMLTCKATFYTFRPRVIGRARSRTEIAMEKLRDIKEQLRKEDKCST